MYGFTLSELNALYYVAFKDWEAEQERKDEEKRKKDKQEKEMKEEEKLIEALKKQGGRVPAKILQQAERRKREIQQQRQQANIAGDVSSLNMEDLIDEFEG